MFRKAICFFGSVAMLLLALCPFTPAQERPSASVKGPVPALAPPAVDGSLQISAKDRCPLCGMYPAKRSSFAAAMVLDDGRAFYFCSNGCLLRAWRQAPLYLGVGAERIRRMVVLDHFSGAPLEAAAALWVAGSDVIGPMGPGPVPLRTFAEVDQFKSRHGGRTVFKLDQMDDGLWNSLFPPR